MPPTLYPDQEDLRADLYRAMRSGSRAPCIVLPTGGGKTVIASRVIADAVSRGRPAAFLVHRKELVDQAWRTMRSLGLRAGVIRGDDDRADAEAPVQVISVATVASWLRRGRAVPTFEMVVHDEAHRAAAPDHRKVVAALAPKWLIGITATPCRAGGGGLGDVFDALVPGLSGDELVARGRLCPARVAGAGAKLDVGAASVRDGDFAPDDVREPTARAIPDVVRMAAEQGRGRRIIAFGLDREHSRALASALGAAGFRAIHVDATSRERDAEIAAFGRGEWDVLCNVDLVTEGFDVPAVDAVLWGRRTKSFRVWTQGNGRALRVAPGKRDALILDPVGNWIEHGWPTKAVEWDLTPPGVPARKGAERGERLRLCEVCVDLWRLSDAAACPRCGWVPPPVPEVATDAEWAEIDRERVEAAERARLARIAGGIGAREQDVLRELAPGCRKAAALKFAAERRGVVLSWPQVAAWWGVRGAGAPLSALGHMSDESPPSSPNRPS